MNNEPRNGSEFPRYGNHRDPASPPYIDPEGRNVAFNPYGPGDSPETIQIQYVVKKKRNTGLIALILSIIILLIVASIAFSTWWFAAGGSDFFDATAISGQAPYKTQEEIIAELNRVVEEGMLNISIASVIEFADGTAPGTAYIENTPSNRYVLRVAIALDSTGEIVYQSGGLRPDSYIENITLSEDLPAGTYPATATFVAYDPDSLEEVGQAAARVTLQVAS